MPTGYLVTQNNIAFPNVMVWKKVRGKRKPKRVLTFEEKVKRETNRRIRKAQNIVLEAVKEAVLTCGKCEHFQKRVRCKKGIYIFQDALAPICNLFNK